MNAPTPQVHPLHHVSKAEIEAHGEAVTERWLEIKSSGELEQKIEAMNKGIMPLKTAQHKRLNAVLKSPRSVFAKIEAVWAALDELGKLIKPYAACRRGCSHCCHQSVLIFAPEAELIGKRIGVKPKHYTGVRKRDDIESGYHNPCPFLKDNACSIYEHRPSPCRSLYNLDRDALLCELIGPVGNVPFSNHRDYDDAMVLMVGEQKQILERDPVRGVMRPGMQTSLPPLGDIRDFFPRGK